MAMMIAWQTLNKLANPQDRRFADAFLVVAPGITIRDRLRVLLPNNPNTIAYVNSAMSRARFYAVELVKFSGKDVSAFETHRVEAGRGRDKRRPGRRRDLSGGRRRPGLP